MTVAWLRVRLACGLLFVLLAVHVVILIDTRFSWQLTLLASEYGHRLAVLALVLASLGIGVRGKVTHMGTALLLTSAAVLLTPACQMYAIAGSLPSRLQAAFGVQGGQDVERPSFTGLWPGVGKPVQKAPEKFVFSQEGGDRHIHFFRAETGQKNAPCLVVIHGGGWENGSATEFPEWNAHWSREGYAVACVEYRLAPRFIWPAARDDLREALAWLKAHADDLGIDATRFVLLGRSAGGQIASACATTFHDPSIRGCIAIYAPHDMFFARRFAYDEDVLGSRRLLRNYLGGDPDTAGEAYRGASAFMLADEHTCPVLLLHGTRDTFVWNMQSRRFAQRLQSLKVPHHLIEMPWAVHGFDWPYDGPGGQITRMATEYFLQAVTSKPPGETSLPSTAAAR